MNKMMITAAGLASVACTTALVADVDVSFDLTGPGGNQVDETFNSSGDLGDAQLTVDFVNQGGFTWAGDLLIGVVGPNGTAVEYGGYDMSFGYPSAGDFPSSWDSSSSGSYSHSFSLGGYGVGGDGDWNVAFVDGYSMGSSTDNWNGTLTLVDLGGGSGNPCDSELRDAPCNADVDFNNMVNVDDLLIVIATFGEEGDGTFRPEGDCAPLTNGDCLVNVDDVLAVIAGFGADCTPVDPTGGCCMADGSCDSYTEAACESMGGNYLGDDSDCSACVHGACCYADGTCMEVLDSDCGGQFIGGSCDDAGCEPVSGACCLDAVTCLDDLTPDDCTAFGGEMIDGVTCAEEPCAAGNDTCESATMVDVGAHAFDTSDATDSGFGEPDDSQCSGTYLDWDGSPDVWFKYVASEGGMMSVSLCDAASYDTSLVLYEGDSCDSLAQVACNGDSTVESGCQSYYSGIYDVPISAGSTHYIRIGGWQAASGAGTMTLDVVGAGATGACCVAGDCVGENTFDECEALGGLWSNGSPCADVTCPMPYTPGGCDVEEGCACLVDGDDSATDCNGGLNSDPPTYSPLTLGQSICGTCSVYVDGPTGGTYRDLDWYENATVNAGGTFTCTIGANAPYYFFVVNLDAGTVDFDVINEAGFTASATFDIPAGSWSPTAAISDWNTDWFCGSGYDTYTMLME